MLQCVREQAADNSAVVVPCLWFNAQPMDPQLNVLCFDARGHLWGKVFAEFSQATLEVIQVSFSLLAP